MCRLVSIIRVSWDSSVTFATLGTAVTTLVVLPLLDVIFDVLLGADVGAPNLVRTGYAAALVALCSSVVTGIVSAAVADRNFGIFQEVHLRRRVDLVYWLGIATVPTLFALLTGASAIGAVFWLSSGRDLALLGRVVVLAGIALLCGFFLGIGAAGIGIDLPDPYLGATIVAIFLPVLTGVVVPLEYYPTWLHALATLVPLSGTITALSAPPGWLSAWLLARDCVVALLWAAGGLLATHHAIIRMRAGLRREIL